jgi:quercetin dioxygenase-like cupin family protein
MIRHFKKPAEIVAAGNKPKKILEYIGRVNSGSDHVSIAHMKSPQGWEEPYQTPGFNEYTVVLSGTLLAETQNNRFEVKEGEAIFIEKGERVKYSTPFEQGADYIAVCIPAFSPQLVNREDQ